MDAQWERQEREREAIEQQIKKDVDRFWIATGIGIVIALAVFVEDLKSVEQSKIIMGLLYELYFLPFTFIIASGIIYGWNKLSEFRDSFNFILIMPIMGWLIYLFIKLVGALCIGWAIYIMEFIRLRKYVFNWSKVKHSFKEVRSSCEEMHRQLCHWLEERQK